MYRESSYRNEEIYSIHIYVRVKNISIKNVNVTEKVLLDDSSNSYI